MKTILSLLILFFVIPQHLTDKIAWHENRKLEWEDFRGRPVRSAGFVASTTSGISFGYSYTIENNKVRVEYSVESFFSPQKSWYMPNEVSEHILKHEQAHFDITELHARILRKRLDKRNFSKKVKSEIESIYRQVEKQRKEMQLKFDSESDHSRHEKNEIHWQKQIAKQLADHDEWR